MQEGSEDFTMVKDLGTPGADRTNIDINQIGFMKNAPKTFVVKSRGISDDFSVYDKDNKVVYSGKLSAETDAPYAGIKVRRGDFSDLNEEGFYYIRVSNGDESYPFCIGNEEYHNLLKDVLKMLTRQRCGMELDHYIAGDVAHPACHTSKARIYGTDEFKDVSGGWHDAGDYGRYVVAGATAVADLLMAYEDFESLWLDDGVGIPESGNDIPDILDEAKYELDWMLKMQDEVSGGVYHKVTCRDFPGFVMPQYETDELVLSPISNTASAAFAAVMAKASIIYDKYDKVFSETALIAAKRAFDYALKNRYDGGFCNPTDIVTGEYGDANAEDEIYWAAVELYKATGNLNYVNYIKDLCGKGMQGLGWSDVGTYANISYMSLPEDKRDVSIVSKIEEQFKYAFSYRLQYALADGYRSVLGGDYIWGSNMLACNCARQLLIPDRYNDDPNYKRIAYEQISYILGQNANNISFVTGYGSNYSSNPHHRPYVATGFLVPGMVVGGPNGGIQDECIASKNPDALPALAYLDDTDSYSTNEIAIYWNTPFLYLLSSYMVEYK